MRLTIDEYSRHFKISKEMIHSKLKEKKLNYIIEDGITYILVLKSSLQEQKDQTQPNATPPLKPKTTVAMILSLYQKRTNSLKRRFSSLKRKLTNLLMIRSRCSVMR